MMRRAQSNLVRSGSSKRARLNERVCSISKLSLMIVASILVLHFQINRPKVTHVYSTRDPFDTMRGGVHHTCGCALPPSLQTPQNPVNGSNSTLNRCYEISALQNANILMYSNFTGVDRLAQILQKAYPDRNSSIDVVQGFHVSNEGHPVFWTSQGVFDRFKQKIPELYLGGYRQSELEVRYDHLLNGETYPDFPTSYVGMSFVFTCRDCLTGCPLSKVNDIFRNISGDLNLKQNWGDCVYWGLEDSNCTKGNNTYQAKCQMYPSATIPLTFAIQRFFGDFRKMPGITITEITPPWDTTSPGYASFDANVLYMNLSRFQSGAVELNFFEIEKGTTAWLQLLDLFPTLDRNCSELDKVQACNGTSLCNLFKGGAESNGHTLRCHDLRNKTECRSYMTDTSGSVSLEDHFNLWGYFSDPARGRNWPLRRSYHPRTPGSKDSEGDWLRLMCMDYDCKDSPPYLVLWETAPAMQEKNSSFNQYLEAKILSDFWAQNSGVCTKTYKNVFRSEPEDGAHEPTMFLETQCSQSSSTSSGAQTSEYCWLTGRYHNLTDSPSDNWHELDSSWNSTTSSVFWCYNVKDQAFLYWFIITFGILFGWLGTIDLLFHWVAVPLANLICSRASRKYPSSKVDTSNSSIQE